VEEEVVVVLEEAAFPGVASEAVAAAVGSSKKLIVHQALEKADQTRN
jgi:hypothetical protein